MTFFQCNQPVAGLVNNIFFYSWKCKKLCTKGNGESQFSVCKVIFFSCYPLCLGSKNFSCSDTLIIIYMFLDRRFNNIVTLNATKGQQSEKLCSLSLQFGKNSAHSSNQSDSWVLRISLALLQRKNELIQLISFGL